jgi:chromosomal replication initiation ATPase DnaA
MRQFALPFSHAQRYEAEAFIADDCNADALAWLERPADWPGLRLAVHGEKGCGKTHLLHVFAARHQAVVLPGTAVRRLLDLPQRGAVAVDDADAGPEPGALLHLLNMAAEAGLPVLLAGRTAPAHWPYTLPDLTSRLRAMPTVALKPPGDALLRAMLARLMAERQVAVPQAVQDFMLLRLPRSGDALREAAARLDRAALAAGGKVTRGLATAVLAGMGCEDCATDAQAGSIVEARLF